MDRYESAQHWLSKLALDENVRSQNPHLYNLMMAMGGLIEDLQGQMDIIFQQLKSIREDIDNLKSR